MLLGKKKNKMSESAQLILARHGREIKYMTLRDRTSANESIVAREGIMNVVGSQLVISCDNEIALRAPLSEIRAYELMNLSGINLIYEGNSYVAYYTKGIENK